MDQPMSAEHDHHDESASNDRFAPLRGKTYWRSLEELAGTKQFEEYVHREFAEGESEWDSEVSRRNFVKLMGASLALAGVVGCMKQPVEQIVPYTNPPETQNAGNKPLFFATAFVMGGYAKGVLAEQHQGRPTKLEGNPDHPQSLGATDVFTQAAVLSLYDPDRAIATTNLGQIASWDRFQAVITARLAAKKASGGQGIAILTEKVTSPTLGAQLASLKQQYPNLSLHQYEPVGRDNARAGAIEAFGGDVQPIYHFDKAVRVLSLDSNFLLEEPGSVRYARDFAESRRVRFDEHGANRDADKMVRMYVVESTPTITGTMADHPLRVRPSEIPGIAAAIARAIGGTPDNGPLAAWVNAVAEDLNAHKGSSLVIAGETQPPIVHALAHAMNDALGAGGNTVSYIDPVEVNPDDNAASLRALVDAIDANQVDTLIILGGNPAYTAPADLDLAGKLKKFSANKDNLSVVVSPYHDETAFVCQWHVPESHFLESWSDARAYDGTVTIIQPLVAPLHASRTFHEVLAVLLGNVDVAGIDIVKNHWRPLVKGMDFDKWWRMTLEKGVVENSAAAPRQMALQTPLGTLAGRVPAAETPAAGSVEVAIRPDPTIWDGRFANNGWLQECPKPLTKVVWDNPALISPKTARDLGVETGDMIHLVSGERSVNNVAVLVLPNQPDGVVTLTLGYGRERGGNNATKTTEQGGFNVNLIRTIDSPWAVRNVTVQLARDSYAIALTQHSQNIDGTDLEGRDIIRVGDIKEVSTEPVKSPHGVPLPLYDQTTEWQQQKAQHKWAAVIDNNACIGCNACVIACQAENNTPVIGKYQIERFNRQMHWLRIDTYYVGGDAGKANGPYFEPMFCQHCELAPCEVVCPVAATSHSVEGINEMTYNRCIGTRYCSNNCPYKVRRFNFLNWNIRTEPHKLVYNPDVTVRQRGVMEKCTYCVQRINHTRQDLKILDVKIDRAEGEQAKAELRAQRDKLLSELQTACQQSCPTEAIIFGDEWQKTPDGQKTELQKIRGAEHYPGKFEVIADLGTKPRNSYLTRFVNRNPAIPEPELPQYHAHAGATSAAGEAHGAH
jgi:MoCo/4Fe-4S cofactor protein with predicted Tat translocation signal